MLFTTFAGDTPDPGTSLSNSFLYLCSLNDPFFPIHDSLHSDQFSSVDNMQRHVNYGDIFKDVRRR
ncbi:hypothetical protein M405DRAFT_835621 [Rhizopogon salebrosus TDB-379]|nr:hypothetical protein M405DRAFT_835621 [Rhizopogon salebrosus TDB-379]